MSIGMIGSSPLIAGTSLALASSSPVTAGGLRDTFQTLATQTAYVERFSPNFLFEAIEVTKPALDEYSEALKALPPGYLKKAARDDFYRLYRAALQGDAQAQLGVQASMRGIAHYLFSSRPDWLLTESAKSQLTDSDRKTILSEETRLTYNYSIATNAELLPVSQHDPAWMTLEAYRIAVETTLLKLMKTAKPYRIIFVPGVRGTGKSRHIIKHINQVLASEYGNDAVEYVNVKDRRNGVSSFIRETMPDHTSEKLPRFLLMDNTPCLIGSATHRRHIAKHVATYLKGHSKRVIVLFGGTRTSAKEQMTTMTDLFKDLIHDFSWMDKWTELHIEAKPLNFIQTMQVLTEGADSLSWREKVAYTEFVLERVPPYLSTLRTFALIPRNLAIYNDIPNAAHLDRFADLEAALRFFRIVYERDIMTALERSLIVPEGYDAEDPRRKPADIASIINYMPSDIEDALEWARETQV